MNDANEGPGGRGSPVPSAAGEGIRELHGRDLAAVFVGLMLVMLMAALDSTIVATALPTIAGDLGGLNHISWVATSYLLAQTVVVPLYGKLGDLFGRRIVLQVGLVIFLIGSALCGLSTSFVELVVFRAVQGLGGGGLMVSAQAAIGDVVAPRNRGRYQGIFGAVFGFATVVGPLIGGAITTSLSWRWIFYVNLPIGVLAIVVLTATLPAGAQRAHHSIDYVGTALLSLALVALVLMVTLGGTTYPWGSASIFILAAVTVAAIGAFLYTERRVDEPVFPPRLLGDRVFVAAGVVALLVGFAMFGAITFLPLYYQVVKGDSPTVSGLQILPLMGGLLLTSIVGGMIVSRTGRYRLFPIAGTAVMTVGLFLLSRLSVHTSTIAAVGSMFVAGFGIGLVMQVLVVAVQNSVSYRDLGVATSGNTLFRNIGSSLGTAVIGTVFASELATRLHLAFPNAPKGQLSTSHLSPGVLAHLPPATHTAILDAYAAALDKAFRVAGLVSIAAFVASWFIQEKPMRTTVTAEDIGSSFAVPRSDDSLAEIVRALGVLVGRQRMKAYFERVVVETGVDLPINECWVLVQIRRGCSDPQVLSERSGAPPEAVHASLSALTQSGLAVSPAAGGTIDEPFALTERGVAIADKLLAAVRDRLEKLLDGWSPEQYSDLVNLLNEFAAEVIPAREPLTAGA
jgi:EmrB/QacA subfamily drug resistance transporter